MCHSGLIYYTQCKHPYRIFHHCPNQDPQWSHELIFLAPCGMSTLPEAIRQGLCPRCDGKSPSKDMTNDRDAYDNFTSSTRYGRIYAGGIAPPEWTVVDYGHPNTRNSRLAAWPADDGLRIGNYSGGSYENDFGRVRLEGRRHEDEPPYSSLDQSPPESPLGTRQHSCPTPPRASDTFSPPESNKSSPEVPGWSTFPDNVHNMYYTNWPSIGDHPWLRRLKGSLPGYGHGHFALPTGGNHLYVYNAHPPMWPGLADWEKGQYCLHGTRRALHESLGDDTKKQLCNYHKHPVLDPEQKLERMKAPCSQGLEGRHKSPDKSACSNGREGQDKGAEKSTE